MDPYISAIFSPDMDPYISAIFSPNVDAHICAFNEPNMGSDEFANQSTDDNTVEYTFQCPI